MGLPSLCYTGHFSTGSLSCSMRVLVIGKSRSIVNWMENIAASVCKLGCDVQILSVNGKTHFERLQRKIYRIRGKNCYQDYLIRTLDTLFRDFKPQLVLVSQAYWVTASLYAALDQYRGTVPVVGFVGDQPRQSDKILSNYMDRVYFTDSSFMESARKWDFKSNYDYLPHAVDPERFHPGTVSKREGMVFVGNRTPYRTRVVSSLNYPLALYGRSWKGYRPPVNHDVHGWHIAVKQTISLYQNALAVLNMKNEINVVSGLNQRSFEPQACGAMVLHDALEDIERCFEPGKEILVYRNTDELNELYEKVLSDKAWAQSIADAGYKRVMAEHTYQHRLMVVFGDLGLDPLA